MVEKQKTMNRIKQLLKLHQQDKKIKEITRILEISKNTVLESGITSLIQIMIIYEYVIR